MQLQDLDGALLAIAAKEGGWTKIEGWPSLGAFDLAQRGLGTIQGDNKPDSIEFKISEMGLARLETDRDDVE